MTLEEAILKVQANTAVSDDPPDPYPVEVITNHDEMINGKIWRFRVDQTGEVIQYYSMP